MSVLLFAPIHIYVSVVAEAVVAIDADAVAEVETPRELIGAEGCEVDAN